MTKDTMLLLEKLKSDESYQSLEIYEYYDRTINTERIDEMFKLLDKLDESVYDFVFLTNTAQALETKRADVLNLLVGMCEIIAEKIEKEAKETFIREFSNNDVRLYSSLDDDIYNANKLLQSTYSRYKLGEKKLLSEDWYRLYEYRLVE